MPLVTTEDMLQKALDGGYAVGAFNVENMEMVKAVIFAASKMEAPVILQTTPSTVRYGGISAFAALVAAETEREKIPVALHLDHGDSLEITAVALRGGYTSLMIDGSRLPFEENVKLTKRVVEIARPNQIPVEAELGTVGGKEDGAASKGDSYTDPAQAREFECLTGIGSLAVGIGTAHGFYREQPQLDIGRLEEIRRQVSIPLVLHGASGLADEDVKACVCHGISKVNFATELRAAYTGAIREFLREKPEIYDPKKLGSVGMECVAAVVKRKIQVCGCQGRA